MEREFYSIVVIVVIILLFAMNRMQLLELEPLLPCPMILSLQKNAVAVEKFLELHSSKKGLQMVRLEY
jgi:hypothetical protein